MDRMMKFFSQIADYARKNLFAVILVASGLLLGATGGYVFWILSDLPRIESLEEYTPAESSKVFSEDKQLIAEYYLERRTFIPYFRIPDHVRKAFIAIEDTRFYEHHGIDFIRIFGAIYQDIKAGGYVQGASTITQQLAKMLFLKPEKSIWRKVKEVALSIQIERRYTKDEIMGLYLNQAYFGTQAYGIVAASQTYFGKSVDRLSVADAALLAALPKSPNTYSPFSKPEKALRRRNTVLLRMMEIGFITEAQYTVAVAEPLPEKPFRRRYNAPYFVEYLRQKLEERYKDQLYSEGLKINSTLDYRMQEIAESAVEKGVQTVEKRTSPGVQAALVAIDIASGKIRAMVGGTDYWTTQFNRATQALRQPGSTFKPIVYLTAFNLGMTPEDRIMDEEITFQGNEPGELWSPQNYYGKYEGEVTLRYALSHSLNSATACLADDVGMARIIKTARLVGITSELKPYLTIALGAADVNPLELTYAFKTFADGKRVDPVYFEKIFDRNGITIEEPSQNSERVIDEGVLLELRSVLRSVVTDGTGQLAKSLSRPVYGKTGTTDDYTDAWFVGFDDNIVLAVWVGRDDHTPIGPKETGATAALPIWVDFMKRLYQ
jgi:penicillin-binding protein 1A